MRRYLAILRGINVGGKRKLPMANLRDSVTKIGFTKVQTYIQSGNLLLVTGIVKTMHFSAFRFSF